MTDSTAPDLTRITAIQQATTQAINNFNQTVNTLLSAANTAISGIPPGATVTYASSKGGDTILSAALGANDGQTTYISGFAVTSSGATSASVVNAEVTDGTTTMYFVYPCVAGVTTANAPLIINFPIPIPAGETNTAMQVAIPALGTGNTNAAISCYGFIL